MRGVQIVRKDVRVWYALPEVIHGYVDGKWPRCQGRTPKREILKKNIHRPPR